MAEVKYQCQGLVPQADAPNPFVDGKTLEMKADNSGHKGEGDCQKKVSIETESTRPVSVPNMPEGMSILWKTALRDGKVGACRMSCML